MSTFSQDGIYHNRVFIEALGNGGLGSLNYEVNLKSLQKEKVQFTFRTGLSVVPGDPNTGLTIIFPESFNILVGQRHFAELGIGETISITTKNSFFMRATLNIGYRFMAPDRRLFYRVTYTPFISHIWDIQYSHWGGASIGYQF